MNKEYKQVASVPEGEKIVSTTTFIGGYYWDLKFPFKHYQEPKYYVVTENAIYQITPIT